MKLSAVLFSLFILAIVVLADMGRLPRFLHVLYEFPLGDKLGHLLLFGLLNFLVSMTILRTRSNLEQPRLAFIVGLILTSLITLEEFSQKYFSSRSFDLLDLLASCTGLIIGGWMALKLVRKKGAVTTG